MSFTKNYCIRCDGCGLFCVPHDEETPFGCKDYENPEPLDPYHYCRKCSVDLYKKWLKTFVGGSTYGYWQKSSAEIRAAKECGLIWIHSESIGVCGNSKDFRMYCYVTPEEYIRLKNLEKDKKEITEIENA